MILLGTAPAPCRRFLVCGRGLANNSCIINADEHTGFYGAEVVGLLAVLHRPNLERAVIILVESPPSPVGSPPSHICPVRLDSVILTPPRLLVRGGDKGGEVGEIVLETSNSGFKRNVTHVSRV